MTSYNARLLPTLPPVPSRTEWEKTENQLHTALRRWNNFKTNYGGIA
jgi:hypothetical protein